MIDNKMINIQESIDELFEANECETKMNDDDLFLLNYLRKQLETLNKIFWKHNTIY